MCDHILGDAAHEDPLDPAAAVGSHTDEINCFIFCLLDNELVGFAPHVNDCLTGKISLIDLLFCFVKMLPDLFRHFLHKGRGDFHLFRVEIDNADHEDLTVTNPPQADGLIHRRVAKGGAVNGIKYLPSLHNLAFTCTLPSISFTLVVKA